MAKQRKLPKRPKAAASLETWKRYEKKCKEVQAYNRKLAAEKKTKERIQEKTRSLGRI